MMTSLKTFIRRVLRQQAGKLKYQGRFESLLQLAVEGMNIGGGARVESSGELGALQYVRQNLAQVRQPVIFDVGANRGDYSRSALEHLPVESRNYAFEPSKATFESLRHNLQGTTVRVCNFGLGAERQTLSLFKDTNGSGLASLYHRRLDHFSIHMDNKEAVTIRTVDDFSAEEGIEHIHFLKLDVEGHELNCLQGASRMLAEDRVDYIQFEFGGCNIDSRTFFQDFFYLLAPKYKLFRIVRDGLHPIDQYKELYELFVTTNFLAERRGLEAAVCHSDQSKPAH